MPDTTLPVFLAASVPASGRAILDGEEARHAATVRRLRAGERLVLSDGAGAMARCVVEGVQAGREPLLTLAVEEHWTEEPPGLRVLVAQALAKGDRGELAVELATEAGADAIVPWRAARSVAKWEDGGRGEKALARWRATARAAAKQARRAHVPEVAEPVTTGELAGLVATMSLAIVLESDVPERLTDLPLPDAGDVLLVVGPEGGITDEELRLLRDAGARAVRLGITVLRTSTAAAVALGALGALTTRWQ
ncbi:ribosomal RNA small subunit methyltransferase E [Amycolatopsis mediterranei S699]|uniref:Ribosomal RNA small subunit methyltransferase E n=1 Tax=Amycolatopsis mediterranei (strain S699) TaxID=713604 RepID=A0A9R0P2Y5_AMYMS|nr:16S rRNA (uracil(1498)-N(3))-methyltransferase [Amycolatopsis mediterranei]AEK45274.1 ribosomal RNA small subunit methyltransferase E [Amycolatopsis mediterranei S699]AFO80064.1 ribosomal RNA small subunit methyltransferase E [Amycolatopsis mediterranei S699]AGT87192.1 ribosomal RNA small subunit methyltransferase E [Amycolatopsis mediterranei RB]